MKTDMIVERPRLVLFATAVPCCIVFGLFAASAGTAFVNGQPSIWAPWNVTLSEAVGMRDLGESARQLMLGADPNRPYEVAGVFRDEETVALTPLEAAVITRELYMVTLLTDFGAAIDQRNATTLQCLARAVNAPAVVDYLIERSPPASCSGIALPWQP